MNIYKITTSKTAFVRAENEDEAEKSIMMGSLCLQMKQSIL